MTAVQPDFLLSDHLLSDYSIVLHDAEHHQWLLFQQPIAIYTTQAIDRVVPMLQEIEQQAASESLHAVGMVAYEAAPAFDPALMVHPLAVHSANFPLLWFGLYAQPQRIKLPMTQGSLSPLDWQPSIDDAAYRSAIQQIKRRIHAGDTYQVNYTFRLRSAFVDDPFQLFLQIIQAQGAGYGAFLQLPDWSICSASPELFFTLENQRLVSRPMKGTIARGLWQESDRQQAAELARSEKNRAENLMIVDMVRNDMGQIADLGSVSVPGLFDLEQYPTLWQMTSTVQCNTAASITEIFKAMFPPASITGAPKARTMRIITELETDPRKLYTGTIGWIQPSIVESGAETPDAKTRLKAQFNVAIRTILIDRATHTAEYGTGGGIVWDSADTAELQECYIKAQILTRSQPLFDLLETMLWTPAAGYFLLDRHLQRLQHSADYFGYVIDLVKIRQALMEHADRMLAKCQRQSSGSNDSSCESCEYKSCEYKMRLTVSRSGEFQLSHQPWSATRHTIKAQLAPFPIDANHPFLYHKTTERSIYERFKQACPDAEEILLWNDRGEVAEFCIGNLVIEKNGQALTPPIASGLLPGTYRAELLENGKVQERTIQVNELMNCDRIWLINSVRKFVAVELKLER
jgi:para-aminobenzoate synthetase/4-amino-4-deoxychorismate lyase